MRIVSIEAWGVWPFYDMTVPGLANYLAAGIYNHNSGKSRSGSEWTVERMQKHPVDRHGSPTEFLVIAETLSDVRLICFEGPAGILRALERKGITYRYKQSPRPMIIFSDGQRIYGESGDDPDVGRGYNASGCWLDELAKWGKSYESWYEGIMPALRADLIDGHPQAFVTTTPKPSKLLREWLTRTDGSVHLIRGSTFDNATNLSAQVITELRARYDGTLLGRQELYGEMLDTMDGALFTLGDIEKARVADIPDNIILTVVGVDPSLTDEGDEMGVVVMCRTADGDFFVLEDASCMAAGREAALHVWRVAARWGADIVAYEQNLGHRWMQQVFRDAWFELIAAGEIPAGTTPPMRGIDARVGKKTRGEPVAMRMQQGRIHHVGRKFEVLEEQLTLFTGWETKESPDRLDAYVHAGRHLIETAPRAATRVLSPWDYVPAFSTDL